MASSPAGSPVSPVSLVAVKHLVVGAGFAGLCAAIKLQEAGERDLVVVERGPDVGGTWRDNTYPGAACDVPSQLYSFSFAPNPDWTRSFSQQPEIQAYIQGVARRSGVLDRFVFDTTVEEAVWDDARQRWTVRTSSATGETTYDAQFVVMAAGGLSEPKMPEIDGLDGFQGEVFHSARWRHDVDLTGKRVAVVGTGASAIQIVPEVAKVAGHLDVYQRTAAWVAPRLDRAYSRLERLALRHVPGLQRVYRTGVYWSREVLVAPFTLAPKIGRPLQDAARLNIQRGIRDPELRRKVTPDFEIGCKRTLISNDYYPALDADNVDLVTDGIHKVTGHAIVDRHGIEREIDVLIVATGFYTTELPFTEHVVGRTGRTLAERWREVGMSAYQGTSSPEFPNLFMIVGPNTGLGHSSMVFIIESQVAHLVDAVRTMRERGLATVEATESATRRFNTRLQRRMQHTVWNRGGCSSWYLDEHGRNTTLWPRSTVAFRAQNRRFDSSAYTLRSAPARSTVTQEVSA